MKKYITVLQITNAASRIILITLLNLVLAMKRIIERIDSKGISRFIPQRKVMWWWFSYEDLHEGHTCGEVEFAKLEDCKAWLLYERTTVESVHYV